MTNSSALDFAQAKHYLTRVLPWSNDGRQVAYVNIHHTFTSENSTKPVWNGRACTSLKEAISAIQFALKGQNTRDIYVCMSTQAVAEEREAKNGWKYKKAIRNQPNAVALKSLFLDIDTQLTHAGAQYKDLSEAAAALAAFIRAIDLPRPSIVVCSGGGLQAYWVLAQPLLPDQWKPLAFALAEATKQNGLHCDTECTIDCSRVLRVPNTFNRKVDPPAPVRIVGTPTDFDYSLEPIEKALTPYKVPVPVARAPASFLENPALFPPRQASASDELSAGIETQGAPINLNEVARECAFVRDAIASGGAAYSQPMWNLTTLIATFTQGAGADAHRMGNRHPGYSKESTETLFDRKRREQKEKGIGWPSCQAISASGCNACQSCNHFAAGKSPLHWAAPGLPSRVNGKEPFFADPWADFVGPEFPLAILPLPLRQFVDAEHRAMGADQSAIATTVLITCAGAIHAETCVQMGDGWWVKPLLWGALVGSPSTMKTPIIAKATAPLRKIDHEANARWRQSHDLWKQSKAAGANPGPSPAKPGRQIIHDATPEKIAEILARSTAGSLMVHDELAGLIGSFDRYGSGSAARSFFLESFNGEPFLKDRVGQGARDENAEIRVDNLALCILGGIQPDRLAKMKDLTSDGLLQRFLPIAIRVPARGDESVPVMAAERDYASLIRSLQRDVPRKYTFSPEATKIRRRVLDRLYDLEQAQGFPDEVIGAIGKMRGYFGRLTVTLHVANEHAAWIAGKTSLPSSVIPKDTAEAVERLLFEFFLPHTFGVYDVIVNGGKDREMVRALASFILASDNDRLRPSDITTGVRKLRGEPQYKIAEWASRFCALGWLQPEDNTPIPRAWLVAPGLRDYFTARREQVKRARAEAHAILSAGGTRG